MGVMRTQGAWLVVGLLALVAPPALARGRDEVMTRLALG